jgi:hypothetical protein
MQNLKQLAEKFAELREKHQDDWANLSITINAEGIEYVLWSGSLSQHFVDSTPEGVLEKFDTRQTILEPQNIEL